MKIESVRIENFRSFKDETIYFHNYTCFIGPNGSGKSTIINALNVFFRQQKDTKTDFCNLEKEDFHHNNTDQPIKITVTFTDLSDAAKNDLSDYVRQDKLIISAVAEYDHGLGCARVFQYGNRLGINDFRIYFENEKKGFKAAELKTLYSEEIQKKYTDLQNASTKPAMEEALRNYEADHPEKCVLIRSEDQFYGIQGTGKLSPYIQWVFISASKDIPEESQETKNTALGMLLSRTVRSKINFKDKIESLKMKVQSEYQAILNSEQTALNEISASLKQRLETWSHPGISANVLWKQDIDKSVKLEEPWAFIQIGERGFEGDLARFGHGLQRSFMLALLQELASSEDENAPTLIMAIEEPEIYQHPPQARYLSETLHELSMKNSQIIVCSHHPLFIPGDDFETVRLVRDQGQPSFSNVSQLNYIDLSRMLEEAGQKSLKEEGMLAKLYPILDPTVNEMFFCNKLILTEGVEDIAYISSYLVLMEKIDIFRKFGCHIVPVGGKSKLIKPLAISNLLSIPRYVIFDADTDKTDKDEIDNHKKHNKTILHLLSVTGISEWPTSNILGDSFAMWKENIKKAVSVELNGNWEKYSVIAAKHYGDPGGMQKNALAIAKALELAWNDGVKSPVLEEITDLLIKFAQS